MTLISGYKFKDSAFLQSDLLLTMESKCDPEDMKIPTYSGSNSIPDTDVKIAGLTQKISIINNNFAVACAGDLLAIRSAVTCVKSYLLHRDSVSLNEVIEYLKISLEDKYNEVELIFINISLGKDEYLELGHINAVEKNVNNELILFSAGSGKVQASENLYKYKKRFFDNSLKNVVDTGVIISLEQFANYMLKEIDSESFSENIQFFFGGGYEIATYFDGKLQKISDILYAYSEADLDEDGILQIEPPTVIIKSKYNGDFLFIRKAKIQLNEKTKFHEVQEHNIYVIPPLNLSIDTNVVAGENTLDFILVKYVCYFVRLKKNGKIIKIYPFVKKYQSYEDFFTNGFLFNIVDGYLVTSFQDNFREELRRFIMNPDDLNEVV